MSVTPWDNGYLRKYRSFAEIIYHSLTSNLSPNIEVISVSAKNSEISASSTEDIWSAGGIRTKVLTAGTVQVISNSANDTAAGTGARTVTILGYDANFNLISETLTTNGVTAVTSTLVFADVYKALVNTAGSTLSNVGILTIRHTTGPVTLSQIPATEGVTHGSHFTIPAGYTGIISDVVIGFGGTGGSKIGRVNFNQLTPSGVVLNFFDHYMTSDSGSVNMPAVSNLALVPLTKVWFDCYSETNNTQVSVSYIVILIRGTFNDA